MTNNVYSLKKGKLVKNDGYKIAAIMRIIAWAALVVGSMFFLINVSEFKSTNVGLMVSLGIIIAGMQIYGIGTFVHLLHTKEEED